MNKQNIYGVISTLFILSGATGLVYSIWLFGGNNLRDTTLKR